jgi:hypothetical protein
MLPHLCLQPRHLLCWNVRRITQHTTQPALLLLLLNWLVLLLLLDLLQWFIPRALYDCQDILHPTCLCICGCIRHSSWTQIHCPHLRLLLLLLALPAVLLLSLLHCLQQLRCPYRYSSTACS